MNEKKIEGVLEKWRSSKIEKKRSKMIKTWRNSKGDLK